MKIQKRIFWLIAIIALYCVWAVVPVSAHAELLRSIPESNAILVQSPPQVELLFSEPLESKLSTIKVYNTNGEVVDAGDSGVDASNSERMIVSLPSLPDGVYSVAWQVVSQIDGHQTVGSFPFAVGKIDASTLPAEEQTSTNLPISALIAKWLLLACVAVLAGQFTSIFFIWDFALRSNKEEPGLSDRLSLNWDRIYTIGLFGALFAIGLGVLAQAGQTTGHELAFPWSKETGQVLAETRFGVDLAGSNGSRVNRVMAGTKSYSHVETPRSICRGAGFIVDDQLHKSRGDRNPSLVTCRKRLVPLDRDGFLVWWTRPSHHRVGDPP